MTTERQKAIEAGKKAWASLRLGCRMDEVVAAVVDAVTPIISAGAYETQKQYTEAEVREQVIKEMNEFMEEHWPEKPYREAPTYNSIRSILLEWTGRLEKHIAQP